MFCFASLPSIKFLTNSTSLFINLGAYLLNTLPPIGITPPTAAATPELTATLPQSISPVFAKLSITTSPPTNKPLSVAALIGLVIAFKLTGFKYPAK